MTSHVFLNQPKVGSQFSRPAVKSEMSLYLYTFNVRPGGVAVRSTGSTDPQLFGILGYDPTHADPISTLAPVLPLISPLALAGRGGFPTR